MSKSPAALHWPKKDKQALSHEQADERPYGINAKRERPSSTPTSFPKRTLSVLLSKFF
ncbi:MAG: hypothetical protein H6657_16440 [Ardenticatenaceae bacterium]|nr:hypothetical protein [Ardenticatenaceae bacterium]